MHQLWMFFVIANNGLLMAVIFVISAATGAACITTSAVASVLSQPLHTNKRICGSFYTPFTKERAEKKEPESSGSRSDSHNNLLKRQLKPLLMGVCLPSVCYGV
jgi:hypothetical protein